MHGSNVPPPVGARHLRRNRAKAIEAAVADASVEGVSLALLSSDHKANDPIMAAVRMHQGDALEILLRGGMPADDRTDGSRPLHVALGLVTSAMASSLKVVEHLLQHGAKPDPSEGDAVDPPLIMAAKGGVLKALQLLLAKGADVNVADRHGRTAMHAVAASNAFTLDGDQESLLRFLAEKGANPLQVDAYGRTPLQCTSSIKARLAVGRCCRFWAMKQLNAVSSGDDSAAGAPGKSNTVKVLGAMGDIRGAIVAFL